MRSFSDSSGGPDEHPQECPADAAWSRADCDGRLLSGQTPKAVARAAGVCPRTVRKWVARYRGEGSGWACAIAARGRIACIGRRRRRWSPSDRRAAPPALDRQADRGRGRRLAGDRQPHPAAPGAQPHRSAGAGRAGAPLRARASWRADPHRHQEARPLRARRPSHHRRSHRQTQAPRRRLGVRPRLHRRRLAHRLLPRSCPTRRRRAPSPSSKPPSPTTQSLGVTRRRGS